MSENFKLYSQYYDLLYYDKDYAAEAAYIVGLIERYHPAGKSILELGAGTGKHAKLFAEKGYRVLGLERSEEMVAIANREPLQDVTFQVADIEDFNLDETYDIALSLFHVVSYLTTNQSLIKTFKNVHRQLNPNGIFIFDVWHSPAVYDQVPEKRTKALDNEQIEVVRKAMPTIFSQQNVVEVAYEIAVKNKITGSEETFHEKHPMRHFSKPEIELLAYATGFELVATEEFLSSAAPSPSTWGVCYVLLKR